MVDFVIGLVGLSYFLVISAATKQHFSSDRYPWGMYLISALSLIGIFTFLLQAFWGALGLPIASLLMILAAFSLFIWAIKHSSKKKLSLAFDEELKIDGIVVSGPWRYVRHPFYLSYIVFWLACAIGTAHILSIIVLSTLTFIYCYSAIREEGLLKESSHRVDYLRYRETAGFLLPKISNKS